MKGEYPVDEGAKRTKLIYIYKDNSVKDNIHLNTNS